MGSWAIKALESDYGLDVVEFLEGYISQIKEEKVHLTLMKVINSMKGALLGETFENIHFLYDNTALAITELYFEYRDNGELCFTITTNVH